MNYENCSHRISHHKLGKWFHGLNLVRVTLQVVRQRRKSHPVLLSPTVAISIFIFTIIGTILGLSHNHARYLVRETLKETNYTKIPKELSRRQRGILMSCPVGKAQNHAGNWKPHNMVQGVEAVIKKMHSIQTNLPLFFGFYEHEAMQAEPWCKNISRVFNQTVDIICFKIPEVFPSNLYGYAKVFAIRHVPVDEVLWIDCDIYPVRAFDALFEDEEYKKTGAMFWPDSRDFFDEKKLERIMSIERNNDVFPLHSWWVGQGFDSGLVLLNRNKCSRQIEAMCRITRAPEMKILRDLSMGDKDLFHVVWMLHGKNFTLVPYIGESGNIQSRMNGNRNTRKRQRAYTRRNIGWSMSSQLKFGRDGDIYALHQLHKQRGFALIATHMEGQAFMTLKPHEYRSYVQPLILTRKDLRVANIAGNVGGSADLLKDIETALINGARGKGRSPRLLNDLNMEGIFGLRTWRCPQIIADAAGEMSRTWRTRRVLNGVASKRRIGEKRMDLMRSLENRSYKNHVHNKFRKRMEEGVQLQRRVEKITT